MWVTYTQMIEQESKHQHIEVVVLTNPPTLVSAHLRGEFFIERDIPPLKQHRTAAIDVYEFDVPLRVGGHTTIIISIDGLSTKADLNALAMSRRSIKKGLRTTYASSDKYFNHYSAEVSRSTTQSPPTLSSKCKSLPSPSSPRPSPLSPPLPTSRGASQAASALPSTTMPTAAALPLNPGWRTPTSPSTLWANAMTSASPRNSLRPTLTSPRRLALVSTQLRCIDAGLLK